MTYLTTNDIAVLINRSVRWTRENLLAPGRIRCLKVGRELRVKPEDFRSWEQANTITQDTVRAAVRKPKGE